MQVRLEWRSVLAVYTAAFATAVAVSALAPMSGLPAWAVTTVVYVVLFVVFWVVAARQGASQITALGLAAGSVLAHWLLFLLTQSWVNTLHGFMSRGGDSGSESALFFTALVVSGIGLATLVILLVGWGWRDGRWRGLIWVAVAEFAVTAVALYFARPGIPEAQSAFSSFAFLVALDWSSPLRVAAAWITAVSVFQVVSRRVEQAHPADGVR